MKCCVNLLANKGAATIVTAAIAHPVAAGGLMVAGALSAGFVILCAGEVKNSNNNQKQTVTAK